MSDEEIQSLLQAQLELPALSNMAIVRCRRAMERVARERLTELGLLSGDQQPPKLKELSTERDMKLLRAQAADAFRKAADAYREAMPPLSGAGNIRDFIACVGHGMLLRVFEDNKEAARLIYAAQIASTAETKRYKSHFEII
jgi:hypothetical protein